MTGVLRRRHRAASAVAGLAVAAATLLTGYGAGAPAQAAERSAAVAVPYEAAYGHSGARGGDGEQGKDAKEEIALHSALRELWADHMQWTYATVDAFFHNEPAVQPSLERLLRNQKDLGAAIVPYYGEAAGERLTELLTTHIEQAVPVLQAAEAGDQAALKKALDDWYANAGDIAAFLTAANPENWPASVTDAALRTHIDQTTVYATDLLKGDYEAAIAHYDVAFDHMMSVADVLARGIIAQFPDKFC